MVETFVQSTDDVVAFLVGQHNLIKDMFDDVLYASETKARERAFIDLRQLLAVHETAEEMIVHPRARRDIDGGDAIVAARLQEEHDCKEQLTQLEGMDMNSPDFLEALTDFRTAVIDHAASEENQEFNQLHSALEPEDLKRMASAVLAAQAIAPDAATRGSGVSENELCRRTFCLHAGSSSRHNLGGAQLDAAGRRTLRRPSCLTANSPGVPYVTHVVLRIGSPESNLGVQVVLSRF